MIKYGVEKDEILEYCKEQLKRKKMDINDALQKCHKHGLDVDKKELLEAIKE